jgi:hypothetical protein
VDEMPGGTLAEGGVVGVPEEGLGATMGATLASGATIAVVASATRSASG